MPDQPERLDRHPALGRQEHAAAEGLADSVVRGRPVRIDGTHRELRSLPGQNDESSAIRGEGKEVQNQNPRGSTAMTVPSKRTCRVIQKVAPPSTYKTSRHEWFEVP